MSALAVRSAAVLVEPPLVLPETSKIRTPFTTRVPPGIAVPVQTSYISINGASSLLSGGGTSSRLHFN